MGVKRHIYQETTEWTDGTRNGVYIFDAKPQGRTAKCVAFLPHGETKVKIFKSPLVLDLKGRTFQEVR